MMIDNGHSPHELYGPCDGFGPGGECSECTGQIERWDGSIVSTYSGEVIKKPPFHKRLKGFFQRLGDAFSYLRYGGF